MAPSSASSQKPSTQMLTIHQMIELLSDLRNQLSTAFKDHTSESISSGRLPRSTAEGDVADQIEEVGEPTAMGEGHGEDGRVETHQFDSLEKLLNNINYLIDALAKTKDLEDKLNKPIQSIQSSLSETLNCIRVAHAGSPLNQIIDPDYLDDISNDIKKLRFQIPSDHKLSSAGISAHMNMRRSRKPAQSQLELPNLYKDSIFEESSAFKEIEEVVNSLDATTKICFLYFAAFPENAVLKKRFLTHWWVGEALLDRFGSEDETPENVAGRILQEFTDKGLIVPVKEEQKKIKKRFKMSPLVRSAAIILAKKEKLLDYDSGGSPTTNSSLCNRIFLVKAEGSQLPKPPVTPILEEKMECIFNVSEPFPDSALEWWAKKGNVDIRTVKVVEWLLKMKNLKVLYLGRWQSALEEHHIEVESTEFLKGLKNMKKLRFLSLQGISWINELPNSIKKLSDLRILDLKSCHNLEKLPKGVGSLKKLTHLDISGCYLLDWMPKDISALTELRVLKGFVVGRSSLSYLKGLKKLRKLSISSSNKDFPDEMDIRALQDLSELRNLSIVWGAELKQQTASGDRFKRPPSKKGTISKSATPLELPKQLQKLDLQCLPKENLPGWLNPSSLESLKKLYLRGGKLKDLGNDRWTAEVLRLKFMTDLKMEWRKLLISFPNLSYLQRVKCPGVTLCPCDENGVWMKP